MGFLKDKFGLDRKKTELIIVFILAVIFVSALMAAIRKVEERVKDSAAAPVEGESPFSSLPEADYAALDKEFSAMAWKRDPFQIGIVKADEASYADSLTGIIWDEDVPVAIFGEDFLRQGEEISHYKILRIKKEAVVLTDGNFIYELRIGQSLADLVDKEDR